jgi:AcrR family transcriptional regulator
MSKGAETRERILGTAFRLAARQGLEGLSLGELAKQLRVSKSGLFAHFKSKEELQIQTLRAASDRFAQTVMVPAFRKARGLPRVRAFFDNWMRWFADLFADPSLPGGCIFMHASFELDDRPGPVREVLVELQQQFIDALARSARIAVEEGHFRRALDADQFAFDLYSILLGYNLARRLLRDPKAERRAREAFAALLKSSSA